jgi:hypothetical protein
MYITIKRYKEASVFNIVPIVRALGLEVAEYNILSNVYLFIYKIGKNNYLKKKYLHDWLLGTRRSQLIL